MRVSDGTRTRDHLDHNQELYQLSYAHRALTEDTGHLREGGEGLIPGPLQLESQSAAKWVCPQRAYGYCERPR